MLANGAFPSNTQSWHNRVYFGLLIAEEPASVPCFLGGGQAESPVFNPGMYLFGRRRSIRREKLWDSESGCC